MNCREASIKISLHVGDDLPPHEVPAVEEHLEGCSLCREEYESFADSRDALLALRGDRGGLDLWDGGEAALDAGTPRRRAWMRRLGWVSGLAAGLVLAVGASAWLPGVLSPAAAGGDDATAGVERIGGESGADAGASPLIERPSQRELLEFLQRNGIDSRSTQEGADEDSELPVAVPAGNAGRRQF